MREIEEKGGGAWASLPWYIEIFEKKAGVSGKKIMGYCLRAVR